MKVCCNGGLNLSVLDGWWDEGCTGDNGWAIGAGEEYAEHDKSYQDDVESRSIYELIEQEIAPLYYARSSDGVPRGWVKRMKRSITTNVPVFNTNRMVKEYAEIGYMPSYRRYSKLTADKLHEAANLAKWRKRVAESWGQIRVEAVEAPGGDPLHVGAELAVKVRIHLGPIHPEDVEVQLFHGVVDSLGEIAKPQTVTLKLASGPDPAGANGSSVCLYTGKIACRASGHYGYCVRVLPRHASLPHPFEPGLVTWG
jgi:starch phosphorylase